MLRHRPLFLLAALLLFAPLACRAAPPARSLQQAAGPGTAPRSAPDLSNPGTDGGRIAFLANDNNIYTIAPGGEEQVALTTDAAVAPASAVSYQHITWAPDGQNVAFVRLMVEDGTRSGALITAAGDGSEQRTLFSSEDIFPFYLFWSPDSSAVTFLSNDPDSNALGLYLSDTAGGQPAILDRGAPYYWAWAPDSSRLFVHSGARSDGRLAFVTPEADAQPQELDLQPTTFQAPSWSADGQRLLLAIENEEGGDSLVLIDTEGEIVRELVPLAAQAAFVLSPDGQRVAITQGRTLFGAGTVGRLQVIDVANPDQTITVPQELVLSFFWSPDGEKIVYFALDSADSQRARLDRYDSPAQPIQNESETLLGVYVFDVLTGVSTFVDAVVPTESFVEVIPYFDQYHSSTTIWSPESDQFVVAALDESDVPTVWVYDAAGGQAPQRLAEGRVAFWSWR